MANPFYTYSGAFIPGTLARAEQLAAEYTSVQSGFALLAVQGTDSGTANTYVVATNSNRSVYTDGNIVEFKAKTSNTGASTINVDGIGVVSLTQSGGTALGSGAIVANTWYRALYNSTYSAWTLIAPSSIVTNTSTISPGAPTNKVGLSSAGGSSLAVVPIDATYALDQGIVPTWTGAHTFANTVAFNSTVTFAAGLALTGVADQYAATLTGSSSTGHSRGLSINAGTNDSDVALVINSQSGGTHFFQIVGTGGVVVGGPTGSSQGLGTINAVGLYVNGAAVLTSSVAGANPTASVGLNFVNGVAATFMRSDAAPKLDVSIAPTWTGAHTHTPSSAVTAVTINAAVNTSGFILNGGTNTVNNYLMQLLAGLGSGFSSGLLITAGTTTADNALRVANAANTQDYLRVRGDGSVVVGAPGNIVAGFGNLSIGGISGPRIRLQDSGAKGVVLDLTATNTGININSNFTVGPVQPINLQSNSVTVLSLAGTASLTVQGYGPVAGALVDMTPDTGTVGLTTLGLQSNVSGTATWARYGNLVSITIPALAVGAGISAGGAFGFTGIPAAIQPAGLTQYVQGSTMLNVNAGVGAYPMRVAAASGTWLVTSITTTSTASFTNGQALYPVTPITLTYSIL